jgi:N-acetylmuramoyl-L-alanine amidase
MGGRVLKRNPVVLFVILISFVVLFLQYTGASAFDEDVNAIRSDIGLYVEGIRIEPETAPLVINGRLLYPARTAFSKMDVHLFWYPDTQGLKLLKGNTIIDMRIGSTETKVNKAPDMMDVPPLLADGTVMVPVRYVAETFGSKVYWDADRRQVYVGSLPGLDPISPGPSPKEPDNSRGDYSRYRVVIDAGHGGKDTGARANGLVEKNLNLDIALRLEKILKERGITIYMTRRTDTYPDLYYRARMANSVSADLFVSIHNNAGHSSYSGTMTLYCPSSRPGFTGKDFARIVQDELVKKLGSKNIGISARPELVVLRKTSMPAVIAEIGFLTNLSDSKKLSSDPYRQDAAEALANAVLRALRSL